MAGGIDGLRQTVERAQARVVEGAENVGLHLRLRFLELGIAEGGIPELVGENREKEPRVAREGRALHRRDVQVARDAEARAHAVELGGDRPLAHGLGAPLQHHGRELRQRRLLRRIHAACEEDPMDRHRGNRVVREDVQCDSVREHAVEGALRERGARGLARGLAARCRGFGRAPGARALLGLLGFGLDGYEPPDRRVVRNQVGRGHALHVLPGHPLHRVHVGEKPLPVRRRDRLAQARCQLVRAIARADDRDLDLILRAGQLLLGHSLLRHLVERRLHRVLDLLVAHARRDGGVDEDGKRIAQRVVAGAHVGRELLLHERLIEA